MDSIVRQDILKILKKAMPLARERKTLQLMELSNQIVHNSSIFQDESAVSVAVIVYSLAKVIQRSEGGINNRIVSMLRRAHDALSADRIDGFLKYLRKVIGEISRLDSQLRLYIEEVVRQAEIKKGSGLYEHGISLARAAKILGISQWELMNYIGKTSIPDVIFDKDIRARLAFARSLFR